MKALPLLFSFRDKIEGNGFIVGVAIDGRALCYEADGLTWLSGVQPGAIAASGADQNAALQEFKRAYLGVLFDMASEAKNFKEFEQAVHEFFAADCESTAQEWNAALLEVRKNHTNIPGMKSINAEAHPPQVLVMQIESQRANPSRNELDCYANAA